MRCTCSCGCTAPIWTDGNIIAMLCARCERGDCRRLKMTYFLILVLQLPHALMLPRVFPDLESCLKVARRINADMDYPGLMYCVTNGDPVKKKEKEEEPKTGT